MVQPMEAWESENARVWRRKFQGIPKISGKAGQFQGNGYRRGSCTAWGSDSATPQYKVIDGVKLQKSMVRWGALRKAFTRKRFDIHLPFARVRGPTSKNQIDNQQHEAGNWTLQDFQMYGNTNYRRISCAGVLGASERGNQIDNQQCDAGS